MISQLVAMNPDGTEGSTYELNLDKSGNCTFSDKYVDNYDDSSLFSLLIAINI
jgi:hypothetical protein